MYSHSKLSKLLIKTSSTSPSGSTSMMPTQPKDLEAFNSKVAVAVSVAAESSVQYNRAQKR
jgi:hypothetical protein